MTKNKLLEEFVNVYEVWSLCSQVHGLFSQDFDFLPVYTSTIFERLYFRPFIFQHFLNFNSIKLKLWWWWWRWSHWWRCSGVNISSILSWVRVHLESLRLRSISGSLIRCVLYNCWLLIHVFLLLLFVKTWSLVHNRSQKTLFSTRKSFVHGILCQKCPTKETRKLIQLVFSSK